jgi:hypothetical protein
MGAEEKAVSALDEIAAAIEAVSQTVGEVTNTTASIDEAIDDATSAATSLGANATVEGLAGLSGEIQNLAQQLGAAGETAKEALATARAIAEGT